MNKIICKKSLSNSLEFINQIEGDNKYSVSSSEAVLNKSSAKAYKKKGSFFISIDANDVLGQEKRHTLLHSDTSFTLENTDHSLVFDFKSFLQISTPIGKKPRRLNCKVKKYHNPSIYEKTKRYYRVIIPTKERLLPAGIIESESLQVDQIRYLCAMITIKYFHLVFHLYSHKIKGKYYLIIESRKRTNLEEFKHHINNVLLAYAFVTGYYPREKRYILSSNDIQFENIHGIMYETLYKSLESSASIIPSSSIRTYFNLPRNIHFPQKSFNKLCQILFKKEELNRVLYLLVEGHTLSTELQASIYSIALETITNIISEENESKFKPISKRANSKLIIKELKKVIDSHSELFNPGGQESMLKKIFVINSPTNKQKLLLPFEILNLELNENEVDAINKRNDFLHGRNPYKYNEEEEVFKLEQITSTLLYCVTILVLKYLDYSGYVMYYPTLNEYKYKKKISDYMIKKI